MAARTSYKPWSYAEDRFIYLHQQQLTAQQMAMELGRSYASVRSRIQQLQRQGSSITLQARGDGHHLAKYDPADVELCRALHDEGLGPKEIAEKMEIPFHSVHSWVYFKTRRAS